MARTLLYENTLPGHGPCLAETVRNRSRKRVPGLVWEWLGGTGRHYYALFVHLLSFRDLHGFSRKKFLKKKEKL